MSGRSSKQPAKRPDAAKNQPQRLQRLLASAGYGSRRQSEELIEAGRVEVDGVVVTKLGTTVDPATSKIRVDGVVLKKQKLVYYAVNKPIGVVTTNSDPQGRARVVDLVPKSERVFAVGRLDRSSEGLILLTNDGDLAQRLTHPKFGVRKVYRVTVAGKVVPETMKQMRKGIYISDGHVRVEGAKILKARGKATEMEIILREGKNREIRRILARLGHKVQQLRRIAVGPLRLGDMPPGAYRVVSREEIKKLQRATETVHVESAAPKTAGKSSGTGRPTTGGKFKSAGKSKGAGKYKAAGKSFGGSGKKSSSRVASKRRDGRKEAGKAPTAAGGKGKKSRGSAMGTALEGSRTTGSVIGADPAPQEKASKRKKVNRGAKRVSKRFSKKKTGARGASTSRKPTKKSARSVGKNVGPAAKKRATKKRVTRKRK